MAKNNEVNIGLVKEEWTQNFTLIGEARFSDFTYKTDVRSEKSDWIYNALNLNVYCGEEAGNVSCELMGGYGSERDNVVYVHGKTEDGKDDFKNSYKIAWEDRYEEDILKDIGNSCFYKVGIEMTDKKELFIEKFLTPYDTIAYIKENLKDKTVIRVSGQMKYSLYNGNVQCKKEIKSIYLGIDRNTKEFYTPDQFSATFTQTILLDKGSCTKDSVDKDKGALLIEAYVLEKFKEFNGWDLTENGKIKGGKFVPLKKIFEYLIPEDKDRLVKIINKLFKVKKGVTQVTFDGRFVESGAVVQTTVNDLPGDIKELIDLEILTEEEALATCSENGSKERRMIIVKPTIRMVGEDGEKRPVILRKDAKFKEEDLIMECLIPKEDDEDEELPFEEDVETIEDSEENQDWLDLL